MKFEILGFECSRTTKLNDSVNALIKTREDESDQAEWIQDADRMKALGVKNTPALAVDGILLFQGCAMSEAGIQSLLEK